MFAESTLNKAQRAGYHSLDTGNQNPYVRADNKRNWWWGRLKRLRNEIDSIGDKDPARLATLQTQREIARAAALDQGRIQSGPK